MKPQSDWGEDPTCGGSRRPGVGVTSSGMGDRPPGCETDRTLLLSVPGRIRWRDPVRCGLWGTCDTSPVGGGMRRVQHVRCLGQGAASGWHVPPGLPPAAPRSTNGEAALKGESHPDEAHTGPDSRAEWATGNHLPALPFGDAAQLKGEPVPRPRERLANPKGFQALSA